MIDLFLYISLLFVSFINNPALGDTWKESHTHPNTRNSNTSDDGDTTEILVKPRIFGGRYVAEDELDFPYQGFLKYGAEVWCSVSLIHRRWFLTAAHCLEMEKVAEATVTVGATRLYGDDQAQVYKVAKIVLHPFYEQTPGGEDGDEVIVNDIGLIKTQKIVVYNERVQPVKLPELGKFNGEEKTYAKVAGWGKTANSEMSNRLRFTTVYIISREDCKFYWPYIKDNNLCSAIDQERSVCPGDCGSPLVKQGTQIGIVSTSAQDCGRTKPNLYTRVSKYLVWIRKVIDQNFYTN